MKKMRIGEVAGLLNVSSHAVRVYANQGLIEFELTPSGQRVFTQEAVDAFLGVEKSEVSVFYVRSSSGDKGLLETQKEALTTAYGEPARVYSDKGSGLNENRKGLNKMLDDAENGLFTTLYVTEKDRLSRFGFSYLERALKQCGVQIVVLGESEPKSLQAEMMQDFMSLLASFSGKFYRLRGYEQQRKLLDTARGNLEKE